MTHNAVQPPDLANRSTVGQIFGGIIRRPPGHLVIGQTEMPLLRARSRIAAASLYVDASGFSNRI